MSDPCCSLPSKAAASRSGNLHDQYKATRGTTLLWVRSFRKIKSQDSWVTENRKGQDLLCFLLYPTTGVVLDISVMCYISMIAFQKVLRKEASSGVQDSPETKYLLRIPLSLPQGQAVGLASPSKWVNSILIILILSKANFPLSYPPLHFQRYNARQCNIELKICPVPPKVRPHLEKCLICEVLTEKNTMQWTYFTAIHSKCSWKKAKEL